MPPISPWCERKDAVSMPRRPFQAKAKCEARGAGGRATAEEVEEEEDDDRAMCSQNLAERPCVSAESEKRKEQHLFAGMCFITTSLAKKERNDLHAAVTQRGGVICDFTQFKPGREPPTIVVVSTR